MNKMTITGENIEVENHDVYDSESSTPQKAKVEVLQETPLPTGDLSKEKSEISKLALYLIGLIIILIICANFLAILFRPEAIKTSGDLLTIIIPITVTGLLGFLSGLAIGRKIEK